ncbi:MAG: DEAD/DEAH box helicase [Polyangiaceae bacterium]|nr:DEAD/DEAH box helicase [Polyangiaceae bacterium]
MTEPDLFDVLGPALAGALEKRGFTSLTPVQKTVLDPALADRDLRITSQTGSGKTVAIGFAVRHLVNREASKMGGTAHPFVVVVVPTRELAKQVDDELTWLFAEVGATVVSVTGGTSSRDERRALARGPQIVVGTPGRLLDHLDRGAIDPSEVGAIVLDEADRLLDLGFRDELDAIFAHMPEERRTHLASATFPREVKALGDAVQHEAALVEGTRLGEANLDIEHVLHLVDGRDSLGAVVNLLLANPDEQILVFARTRADVADMAGALVAAGFAASSLSGEMEQPQRDRALAAFKRGDLRVLVATDVAARGIDVPDIARVIHAQPPGDADTYTHRSGRTGRAGNKGISSTLVPPSIMDRVLRLLHRAGVKYRFEKIPSAEQIRRAQDDQLIAELTRDDGPAEGEAAGKAETPKIDARARGLAERLVAAGNVERTMARLIQRFRRAEGPEPQHVRPIEPPSEVARPSRRSVGAADRAGTRPTRAERSERSVARPRREDPRDQPFGSEETPAFDRSRDSQRPPRSSGGPRDAARGWALFQVTWGEVHGADSRRLLAMLCRRGGIESADIGAIRVGRTVSTVEVAADVADHFAEFAGKPDTRDPRIKIGRAALGETSPERFHSDRPPPGDRRASERPPFEPRRASERPPFEPRHPSERPTFESREAGGKKAFAKKPFARSRPVPSMGDEGAEAPQEPVAEKATPLKGKKGKHKTAHEAPKKGWVKKPASVKSHSSAKRRAAR